ncbi:transcription elongation regulator 1 [Nephila pilipes]|uniref:Transcription elongation regulator 1 n=1 Tax=Nephila pilipes TaxID=299642 RepID=A0A8X6UA74_NEPPI|nr:transcription elongation regulator 1 [Nephila pilipes]
MHRNEHPGVMRHRHSSRFEKPPNFTPRYPPPFTLRRSSLFPRRRGFCNRFPNQGFIPFRQPAPFVGYRPSGRPPLNTNFSQNYNTFTAENIERSDIPFLSSNHSENIDKISSSNASAVKRGTPDLKEFKNASIESPNNFGRNLRDIDDLWIETLAPNGRTYYYNATSRVTRWDKPENVRIMSLDHIKAIANVHHTSPSQEFEKQNMPPVYQPTNQAPFVRSFPPVLAVRGFSSGLFMFPPPNLCNPPPFQAVQPPANMLSVPQISCYNTNLCADTSVKEVFPDYTNEPAPLNSTEMNFGNTFQESQISIDTSNNLEQKNPLLFNIQENSLDEMKQLSNVEEVKISVNNAKELSASTNEIEMKVELSPTKNSNDPISQDQNFSCDKHDLNFLSESHTEIDTMTKSTDKSRPVSSTPLPGCKWCIVWTGEEKVFFYNADFKVSIWEMPDELKNRTDVQKLIQSPPLITGIPQSNTISESNTKKLKIEDGTKVDTSESEIMDSESTEANEHKAIKEKEDIPHETRVQLFLQMLAEKNISAFSTWEKELHKIVFDSRYLLLSHKERKQKFELYLREKLEVEKNMKKIEVLKIKDGYRNLLREAGVTIKTRFIDFAHHYCKDLRFKAVEKLKDRENMFNDFIDDLRSETKYNFSEPQKSGFLELLKETKSIHKLSDWSDVKKEIRHDTRFLSINKEAAREKLFIEYVQKHLYRDISESKEKVDRVNASIQIRKEEVQRDLLIHLKERSKEYENHKREATINSFKALLIDLVRKADTTWHEAKKMMKADHRWSDACNLRNDKREQYFEEHIHYLVKKKREHFRQFLNEIHEITLISSWKDIRKTILSDPRCKQFSNDERKCEKEFKDYIKDKLRAAKEDFKELLKETKIITHTSKNLMKTSNHLESIEKALEKDKRYLVLKCIEKERKEILLSHIDKLHAIGPPPPPTATDPAKR